MAKKIIEPKGLPVTMGPYSQVVEGVGERVVFISGQVGEDIKGDLVGPGDIEAQVRQTFANIRTAVQCAGGDIGDITKLTILITRLDPEVYAALGKVRKELFGDGDFPASTLMQVAGLANPDWLVEIEAYAVI